MDLYIHSPHTPSWHSAELVKQRENVTFLPFYGFMLMTVIELQKLRSVDEIPLTIMAPVKLRSELYLVLSIRRWCVLWWFMPGAKLTHKQHPAMLRVLSARWPFRRSSTRWESHIIPEVFKKVLGNVHTTYNITVLLHPLSSVWLSWKPRARESVFGYKICFLDTVLSRVTN
jgi:hypothetical protein